MEQLPRFETPVQKFLRQIIIDQPYLFLDYWSIVHFGSGLLLGFSFAVYYPKKTAWLWAFLLLALYELLEVSLDWVVFVPETWADKTWDLIFGLAGFFISFIVFKKIARKENIK